LLLKAGIPWDAIMNMPEGRAESYIDALIETVNHESPTDSGERKTYLVKR